MTDTFDTQQRPQQFEAIAREYERIEQLIEYVTNGQDIERYTGKAVLSVDPKTGKITSVNSFALELLGYDSKALIGKLIADIETPIDSSNSKPRTYIEGRHEEHVYPAKYLHKQGDLIEVEVHKQIVLKPDVAEMLYVLVDHSLSQRVWRELQRREDDGFKFQQKLKTLNEITSDLSRIESHDAICWHAVKYGIERLGFDRLGIWFLDTDHEMMVGSYGVDERGEIRAEHNERWSYKDTFIMQFLEGKTEAAIALDNAPIYDNKSEVIQYGWHISAPMLHGDRFIGVITSDNYLNKQPMRSFEPELLRLYGITVGHLTELARQRERAFALRLESERSKMLRNFIIGIGHDFRTPLTLINTKGYLITRTESAEKRNALVDDIHQQVRQLSDMLNHMLEFIEMENHLKLTRTEVHIHALLNEIIKTHRYISDSKHIRTILNCDPTLTANADLNYIRRALEEIYDNAVHYTGDGGLVEVNVTVYDGEIGISIRDNGVGMDTAALEDIFKPLYRIDEARTEHRSGLGLSIAKIIVEAHGGRITAQSVLGKGSTFEIILPQA